MSNSIYVTKPMMIDRSPGYTYDAIQACIKIPYKNYEISIACDNSCGAFKDLKRSELRIYDTNDSNVTHLIFSDDIVVATSENLKQCFEYIDKIC